MFRSFSCPFRQDIANALRKGKAVRIIDPHCVFGNMMNGMYEGDLLNNQKTVTIWADADLKVVNDNI